MKIIKLFAFYFIVFNSQYTVNCNISNRPISYKLRIEDAYSKITNQKDILKNVDFKNITNFTEDVLNFFNNFHETLSIKNTSSLCYSQLFDFSIDLLRKQDWAISVFDAFGKPTSGIKLGSFNWLGEFSECINTKGILTNSSSYNWNGKYCTIQKPINPLITLKFGICIPDSCQNTDIANLLNLDTRMLVCQEPKPLESRAIVPIIVIALILLCVLIGTFLDFYLIFLKNKSKKASNKQQSDLIIDPQIINNSETENDATQLLSNKNIKFQLEENIFFKIFYTFSIYSNTKKLFTIQKSNDQLDCIHGIKFFSFGWVLLGHNWIFSFAFLDNIVTVITWTNRFTFMSVVSGPFSVDSFFLMSGLLGSYLFIKEINKNTNKAPKVTPGFMFKFYFHRLWRITPFYMIVLMISATLTKYMGQGPLYPKDGFEIDQCKDTWWTNLLYINNFKSKNMCFGISWYLANDMQFHWISPIVLIPLALGYKFIGLSVAGLMLIANILSTALVIYFNPGSELGMLSQKGDYFDNVYITPWCRIGPFVVGMVYGYLIYLSKSNKISLRIRKEINIGFWIISLFFLALMVFGIYPDFKTFGLSPDYVPGLSYTSHVLYNSFSRIIWAIFLGYIIYSCSMAQGSFINKFLSLKIWVPLSRLSFGGYLVHFMVMYYYFYTLEHPLHFQNLSFSYHMIGSLALSYFVAYIASMLFEVPLLGLEKFILKRK